jgi:NAD(P)-dependent dehydrogenase (short-subunit alcohol dehydrogenase family)
MMPGEQPPDYESLSRLDGKTVMVIGGSQGAGRHVCHALSQFGASVLCVGRNIPATQAVAREVGGEAIIADFAIRAEAERAFELAGRGQLHGIVDAAGSPQVNRFEDITDAQWTSQFDAVLLPALASLQIGARLIAQSGGGAITLIGSIAGSAALPGVGPAYGSAKAALHHLTRIAATRLGPQGVRVNAIAPGVIMTPEKSASRGEEWFRKAVQMHPLRRLVTGQDVAALALFLNCDLARNLTGQVIVCDAGLTTQTDFPPMPSSVPSRATDRPERT